jgi:pimeloyl-ACP methyl ester carboxylesterase
MTLLPVSASAQATAPSITATPACEQWVALGGGPARSMVYSTYALDKPNTAVTRALVMVHGTLRNADHYFATATAAGFLAGALNNTVIIAPHFIASPDKPQANEVVWPNRGDSWRSGGMSTSNPTLSAFDFMDQILRTLSNKKMFPNLKQIVVTGHSAGGQFATRYEMANKVHGTLGDVSVTYVVANPSSYAWPAAVRPLPTGDANPATADKEALGPNGEKVNTQFTYGPFNSTDPKVANYNHWPSGLESRTGYTAQMSDDQLKKQLVERPTTYLLGQVDVLPLGGFDSSPSAMTQGPTLRARGEAFFKYVNDTLGAKHNAIIVPECGHNDRCIFTTDVVFPVIFPK